MLEGFELDELTELAESLPARMPGRTARPISSTARPAISASNSAPSRCRRGQREPFNPPTDGQTGAIGLR